MNQREKNQNGITLVALIITAIIMLILTGITLSTLLRKKWYYIRNCCIQKC